MTTTTLQSESAHITTIDDLCAQVSDLIGEDVADDQVRHLRTKRYEQLTVADVEAIADAVEADLDEVQS